MRFRMEGRRGEDALAPLAMMDPPRRPDSMEGGGPPVDEEAPPASAALRADRKDTLGAGGEYASMLPSRESRESTPEHLRRIKGTTTPRAAWTLLVLAPVGGSPPRAPPEDPGFVLPLCCNKVKRFSCDETMSHAGVMEGGVGGGRVGGEGDGGEVGRRRGRREGGGEGGDGGRDGRRGGVGRRRTRMNFG